ncbi:immunoreactive 14 kDa protein BA14k [Sinorhizobium sojae CCBAU 05684]|uniref:Lectin-like protein BA14k n=1 Tax=Sinorhizobium sojae CCBAU 05684 TaxID=716928 RepID=A0A249PCV2_9HYPH|nr:BA14K family protein [Sinorhizobium sojae]ASY63494.1 immunoreactive 14 kDa protein BA14k [Sinorhizobium sojae CCBAU 05684]
MKRLAILALSLATALSGVPPAGAFPILPTVKTEPADVQRVQFPYERGENNRNDRCRGPHCWRGHRDGYRYDRYRDRRHRYSYRDRYHRRHRDRDSNVGAIIGGLAAGALLGGLLAQPRQYGQPRYYGGGSAHTRWCYGRYRSYRAYDNTFQPYQGPRRACISPYL